MTVVRSGGRLWLVAAAVVALAGCATGGGADGNGARGSSPERRSAIYLDLGTTYLQQGEPRRALENLKKAQDQKGDSAEIHNALGLTYQRLGFTDKARSAFERARDLDPNDPRLLNNYGVFLATHGEPDRARSMFHKSLDNPMYSTPENAYYNLAWLDRREDRLDKARQHLRTALQVRSDYPAARISLAQVLRNLDRPRQARKVVEGLLEGHSQHLEGQLLAGELALALGDEQEAVKHLDRVVDLAPESALAERSRKLLSQIEGGAN